MLGKRKENRKEGGRCRRTAVAAVVVCMSVLEVDDASIWDGARARGGSRNSGLALLSSAASPAGPPRQSDERIDCLGRSSRGFGGQAGWDGRREALAGAYVARRASRTESSCLLLHLPRP